MRSKIITLLVVVAVFGGIIAVNKFEPERVAREKFEIENKDAREQKAAEDKAMAEIVADGLKSGQKAGRERFASGEDVVFATEIPGQPLTQAPAGGEKDYTAVLETSKGRIVIEVKSELSFLGARQFKEAINAGVYNGARFFRVIPGFMVQFGIAGDPKLSAVWKDKTIYDDPVKASNTPGMLTFAKSGIPNSRTTQLFINYGDNSRLDRDGFAPFGKVIQGMDVATSIFPDYKEKPDQNSIQARGNAYLNAEFPQLDYIIKAYIVKPGDPIPAPPE